MSTSFLNRTINILLILAIASSFFIIKGGYSSLFIQPFNIIAAALLVLVAVDVRISRKHLDKIKGGARGYAALLTATIGFVVVGIINGAMSGHGITIGALEDLVRLIELAVVFLVVLYQASKNRGNIRNIYLSFFIAPIALAPALFVRDMGRAMTIFPAGFLDGYRLQGFQYNPTSLAVFIIIPIAFAAALILSKKSSGPIRIMIFGISAIVVSLMFWTGSREGAAAILAVLAISGIAAIIKRHAGLLTVAVVAATFLVSGFALAPPQAKSFFIVHFYPKYQEAYLSNPFLVPRKFAGDIVMKPSFPDFVSGQERHILWPRYFTFLLTHPVGFGPQYTEWVPASLGLKTTGHSIIIQAGLWGGWGAMVAIFMLAGKIGKTAFGLVSRGSYDYLAVGLAAAAVGVGMFAVLNDYFLLKPLWIIAALIPAYALSLGQEQSARNNSS